MSLSKNSREKPRIGLSTSTNNSVILVKLSGKATELDKERRQMIRKEVTSTWCRICLTIDKINDVCFCLGLYYTNITVITVSRDYCELQAVFFSLFIVVV